MQFVLVHGAWQGGWCWEPLALCLRSMGHKVSCPDLPGAGSDPCPLLKVTYELYYQSLEKELERYLEPVVLVAHSMAGILAAPLLDAYASKISHLFLIAAFVAQDGQSLLDIAMSGGPSEIPHIVSFDLENQTQSLDMQKVKEALYHDCPSAAADWAIGQLQPQPMQPLMAPVYWKDSGRTAHKRTYLFCENDRDVHPVTQNNILENYPCRIIKLQSGHFPFLSQPQKLAEILACYP